MLSRWAIAILVAANAAIAAPDVALTLTPSTQIQSCQPLTISLAATADKYQPSADAKYTIRITSPLNSNQVYQVLMPDSTPQTSAGVSFKVTALGLSPGTEARVCVYTSSGTIGCSNSFTVAPSTGVAAPKCTARSALSPPPTFGLPAGQAQAGVETAPQSSVDTPTDYTALGTLQLGSGTAGQTASAGPTSSPSDATSGKSGSSTQRKRLSVGAIGGIVVSVIAMLD